MIKSKMKNIHLLPTDKPSKLTKNNLGKLIKLNGLQYQEVNINQHIYITSDEEIKEGDWVICWGGDYKNIEIVKLNKDNYTHWIIDAENYKKIILTTDPDLIADGVQAIDDDFLEWFVKNPTCQYVEVKQPFTPSSMVYGINTNPYEIIFPQEEPKQETLEEYINEVTKNFNDEMSVKFTSGGIKLGAKWQAERMYTEEEVLDMLPKFAAYTLINADERSRLPLDKWFEQFKKK
jgi:hypothetical protein